MAQCERAAPAGVKQKQKTKPYQSMPEAIDVNYKLRETVSSLPIPTARDQPVFA